MAGATLFAKDRPSARAGTTPAVPTTYGATAGRPDAPVVAGTGPAGHGAAAVIDMAKATAVVCRPPVAPGPGHPDRLVSQLFNVTDGHQSYLLGWQVVPYRGVGTYRLAQGGNLLALEPPTGGSPLGYGKGTITFFGGSHAGSVNAVVAMSSGAAVAVHGLWQCASSPN